MTKYFRITAYYPKEDFCFIMDSNGLFEKMWQFSSFLVHKDIDIIEVSSDDKFLEFNIPKVDENNSEIILRATAKGKPQYKKVEIDGKIYTAVCVGDKLYVPDKTQ